VPDVQLFGAPLSDDPPPHPLVLPLPSVLPPGSSFSQMPRLHAYPEAHWEESKQPVVLDPDMGSGLYATRPDDIKSRAAST
tara:strand:+ start:104 stop:346 length:243 start_codon:yes stop_codon:yes gene_type:complete